MEQLPKLEPLISNKMLGENMDVYEASLEDNTSHDVTMRLNMTTAYGAGARNVRDIYEPRLATKQAEIEGLRERNAALTKALGVAEGALEHECKCPEPHCMDGAIPTMPDGEPEQCQWCFEHSIGLAALSTLKQLDNTEPR